MLVSNLYKYECTQGRPRSRHGHTKCVTEILGVDKNKEVGGGGAKFKFGQLILRKIIKIVATIFRILKLKCTKFDFGWGSAPDPAGRAHSAPIDPLAGFSGSYC